MAKQPKRPNKARSLIAQPLFRSRQEQPKKGKGSYRREASQRNWEASVVLAARIFSAVIRSCTVSRFRDRFACRSFRPPFGLLC